MRIGLSVVARTRSTAVRSLTVRAERWMARGAYESAIAETEGLPAAEE